MPNTAEKGNVIEDIKLIDSTSKIHQKLAKEKNALPAKASTNVLNRQIHNTTMPDESADSASAHALPVFSSPGKK